MRSLRSFSRTTARSSLKDQSLKGSAETRTAFSSIDSRISSKVSSPIATSTAGLSIPSASSVKGLICLLIMSWVLSERGPFSIAWMICRMVTMLRVTRRHQTAATCFCRRRKRPCTVQRQIRVGWSGRKIRLSAIQFVAQPTMRPKTGSTHHPL